MPRTLSRRFLLATPVLILAGCGSQAGQLAVGQPSAYTPPPPGIDDLFRADAISLTARALGACVQVEAHVTSVKDEPGAQMQSFVSQARKALSAQGHALRTGAEDEKAGGTFAPQPPASPADSAGAGLTFLAEALTSLRETHAFATLQVSAPLAQVTAAAGAWCAWALARVSIVAQEAKITLTIPPAPTAKQLVPQREVPATDPPTEASLEEFRSGLASAAENEFYASYAYEVIAAHRVGAAREKASAAALTHSKRGELYASTGEEIGAAPVERKAGYPLPFSDPTASQLADLQRTLVLTSLTDACQLSATAPFEQRAPFIRAWLDAGAEYGRIASSKAPLPVLPGLHGTENSK